MFNYVPFFQTAMVSSTCIQLQYENLFEFDIPLQ